MNKIDEIQALYEKAPDDINQPDRGLVIQPGHLDFCLKAHEYWPAIKVFLDAVEALGEAHGSGREDAFIYAVLVRHEALTSAPGSADQ